MTSPEITPRNVVVMGHPHPGSLYGLSTPETSVPLTSTKLIPSSMRLLGMRTLEQPRARGCQGRTEVWSGEDRKRRGEMPAKRRSPATSDVG
jgi:hypothetical protein